MFLKYCPHRQIFGFEPVLENFHFLQHTFPKAQISNIAVANKTGTAEFFIATGRPARSRLSRKIYPDPGERVEITSVQIETLDNLIPDNIVIDFIKIDIEGFELAVLNGAEQLVRDHRPALLFEHKFINDQTVNSPTTEIYGLVSSELGFNIWTLRQWLDSSPPLNKPRGIYFTDFQSERVLFLC